MGRLGEIQIIDVDIEMFKFQYEKVHNSNLDGYTPGTQRDVPCLTTDKWQKK